ncbi:T9SS type A sorting domain-containing protein [Hymenobacter sp. BT683]|uniref:T9SS type A sorting domain-containing protein n=1 Tax=Hymenobacter jeongseonensis TaxID=2791027 RepID=A0ABS0II94_9BACT|nr:T9SS type A sorting domain-containing protein [Hymenobacter jeongseonensis]MBF9238082.1 T9SS type A sorting domain-containing protein [Hymenobacter jeongseonensis]
MKNLLSQALPCRLPRPLAALGLLLATAGAAHAQTTTTFSYTGASQTYVVPAGVTQLQVVATGARAGNIATRFGPGGPGAVVTATVTVVPNETLTVVVGGTNSGASGGYNGGGNGAGSADGGGGATDLRRTGAATGDYLSTRNALVVAGGGGGGISSVTGGGGGGTPSGGNGGNNGGIATGGGGGGSGATQSNAGAGGLAYCVGTACGIAGGSGSNGSGGTGSVNTGAGGGGGYYGGGGGAGGGLVGGYKAVGGGGGGGSSWAMPTGSSAITMAAGANTGNGTLTITAIRLLTLTAVSPTNGPVGTSVTLTGTNLTGATAVRFNGTAATTFAVVDETTVTATVPAGATTGPVTVTSPDGTSNGVAFAVTTAPTVSTAAPGSLTPTSAGLGGNATADGGTPITSRGVVYSASSSNAAPTLGGTGVTTDSNGSGVGTFLATISGLTPGTAYAVRAYATNAVGTGYGAARTFTTPCEQPVLTVPADQSLAADASQCHATRTFAASATGTPAPALSYAVGDAPIAFPYAFPVGTTTVTVTATNCGGSVSNSFAVTVQDRQAPVARTQNITVPLVNGQATITAAQVNDGSTDNCTSAAFLHLSVSPSTFACATAGINQVTLTVTDASGNEDTQTATVTVTGTVPQPAINVSPSPTFYLGFGPQTATLTASGEPGATYRWSPATNLRNANSAAPVFTALQAGTFRYTVAVTNGSGCTGTASVTLTVVDARCSSGKKLDKVLVCHNGNTLCVSPTEAAVHVQHGDKVGPCAPASAAAAARPLASQAAALSANLEAYPNPFTTTATVRFRVAHAGPVQLQVYNALGQVVSTLYHGTAQAGELIERSLDGAQLNAGLYTCRLLGSDQPLTQRLVLTK